MHSSSSRATAYPVLSGASSGSHSQHGTSVQGSMAGLTQGGSTSYSSGASITTSQGASRLKKTTLAHIDQDGVLILPSPPANQKYECPFDRLGCLDTFTAFQPWYDHSLTHFKGFDPPTTTSCCFCTETFDKKKGSRSWKARMEHVKQRHHDRGEQLGTSRFDSELYHYLWSKKLLSDVQYKDLNGGTSSFQAISARITAGRIPGSGIHTLHGEGSGRSRR